MRDRHEIIEALHSQRAALAASGMAYDKGETWEAERLSVAVFNLVHDKSGGMETRSILTQLSLRDSLEYTSTARSLDPRSAPTTALCGFTNGSQGWCYFAYCEHAPDVPWLHSLSFNDWWSEIVFRARDGQELSRYGVAKAFRNQDGGAHFGHELKGLAYKTLRSDADSQLSQIGNGKEEPLAQAHLASMRQIAHELEVTLTQIDLSML